MHSNNNLLKLSEKYIEGYNGLIVNYKGYNIKDKKNLLTLSSIENTIRTITPHESELEKILESSLKIVKINYLYNKVSFEVGYNENGKKIFYMPDFIITDIEKNNKTIFIEIHGHTLFNDHTIEKYSKFYSKYNKYIYFIIITNKVDKELNEKLYNLDNKISDEIWYFNGEAARQNIIDALSNMLTSSLLRKNRS
ncbi:MAG: hypothetical protein ACP5RI_03420 [Candidatus Micrarchaeia archaeon]